MKVVLGWPLTRDGLGWRFCWVTAVLHVVDGALLACALGQQGVQLQWVKSAGGHREMPELPWTQVSAIGWSLVGLSDCVTRP